MRRLRTRPAWLGTNRAFSDGVRSHGPWSRFDAGACVVTRTTGGRWPPFESFADAFPAEGGRGSSGSACPPNAGSGGRGCPGKRRQLPRLGSEVWLCRGRAVARVARCGLATRPAAALPPAEARRERSRLFLRAPSRRSRRHDLWISLGWGKAILARSRVAFSAARSNRPLANH